MKICCSESLQANRNTVVESLSSFSCCCIFFSSERIMMVLSRHNGILDFICSNILSGLTSDPPYALYSVLSPHSRGRSDHNYPRQGNVEEVHWVRGEGGAFARNDLGQEALGCCIETENQRVQLVRSRKGSARPESKGTPAIASKVWKTTRCGCLMPVVHRAGKGRYLSWTKPERVTRYQDG